MTRDRSAPPGRDWRNGGDYTRLRGIDRASLMWEWLRRDSGYIAWHARASSLTRGATSSGHQPSDDPAQWGIHFRRAPGARSPGSPDRLACRSGPGHVERRRNTHRFVGSRWGRSGRAGTLADDGGRWRRYGACRTVRRLASHSPRSRCGLVGWRRAGRLQLPYPWHRQRHGQDPAAAPPYRPLPVSPVCHFPLSPRPPCRTLVTGAARCCRTASR